MAQTRKYYVVWSGRRPGVYPTWDACKAQVEGFEGAKYKGFESEEAARKALNTGWKASRSTTKPADRNLPKPTGDYLAVDAACSGNPGRMEYRGIFSRTGNVIFHQGPFEDGTNNIGEFLALVHALALQTANKTTLPIYSDSANAIAWVRKKTCNTKLERKPSNEPIFDLIERAEHWLATHTYAIPIIKWETALWGEIPADFGRK